LIATLATTSQNAYKKNTGPMHQWVHLEFFYNLTNCTLKKSLKVARHWKVKFVLREKMKKKKKKKISTCRVATQVQMMYIVNHLSTLTSWITPGIHSYLSSFSKWESCHCNLLHIRNTTLRLLVCVCVWLECLPHIRNTTLRLLVCVCVCVIWVFLTFHAYMVIVYIPTNNPLALYYLCSIHPHASIDLQITY